MSTAPGRPGAGEPESGATLRRRLGQLVAARLALCLAVLGVALLLTAQDAGGEAAASERGLYGTVVVGFLSTLALAGLYRRVRSVETLAIAQVAVDVVLVTSLVHWSGGPESLFGFLYVPITVYAALLLGRRGAYGATALAAAAYGVLLLAPGGRGAAPLAPEPVRLALFGVHAGALLLVAFLASALSRERDRAGRALDERTRDLQRLQRLHERTVDSLTSGLLTTDGEGIVTSFNPEAEHITGLAAREALGRRLAELIPGAPGIAFAPHDRADRARARLRYRNARGDDLHLGIAGSVLRSGDGSPAGHVVIFQDVSRVVDMELELRRQERLAAVGQLSAHLAHEIRNPLAAISGSIQILEGSLADEAHGEVRQLLRIAVREADRLNGLITDFLHYARPAPAKPEPVCVADVAADVMRMFDSVCPPGVRVSLDASRDLCVLADEGGLRQVLWNLFLNAVQAMPEGGALDVSVREASADADEPEWPQEAGVAGRKAAEGGRAGVEIEVADTGCGIPGELLDRIFDPFFTTKLEGTGLGLATVHRVVESNGGRVEVESSEGAGTRFRIRLPRAEAEAT